MKKIILGSLALLAAASFTSCDKCASSSCATSADSLAVAYGDYVGAMVASDIANMGRNDKADKQEFVRGMQLIFGAEDSQTTRMGMQTALQMLNELSNLEEQGIELDHAAVMLSLIHI